MFYRVEQLTIHLQLANGREARQDFNSPKRYVLHRNNVIPNAKQSPVQNSRRKMDFEFGLFCSELS